MANNASLSNAIYDELVKRIRQGDFADGKRLPTEKELAAEFYVSRITPKRALDRLAEEGIITRIPGRGSFLIENSPCPLHLRKSEMKRRLLP